MEYQVWKRGDPIYLIGEQPEQPELGEDYELGISWPASMREAAEAVGSVALSACLCWAGVQVAPAIHMAVRAMVTMLMLAARQHGAAA